MHPHTFCCPVHVVLGDVNKLCRGVMIRRSDEPESGAADRNMKKAYEWLKRHNEHYEDTEWSEDNAKAWTDQTEEVPTREE